MNNALNEKLFDVLLSEAFIRYDNRFLASLPSDAELKKVYQLPEKELHSVINYYKRLKKAEGKRLPDRRVVVYLKRIAVIILVVFSAFCGLALFNDDVRAAVIDAAYSIIEYFDGYLKISASSDTVHTPQNELIEKVSKKIDEFEIGYIPEDYTIKNERRDETVIYYTLCSESGEDIQICISYSFAVSFYSDTEHTLINRLDLGGCSRSFIMEDTAESPVRRTIYAEYGQVAIMVTGCVDSGELIKIVEGIIS